MASNFIVSNVGAITLRQQQDVTLNADRVGRQQVTTAISDTE
jgi:hypothetical protein